MWTIFGTTYEWSADWVQSWAGWAQAVGTIAAVWMAARLAQKSREQDQLDRLTAHYDALEVLYQACGRLIMNLHNAAGLPQSSVPIPHGAAFADLLEALQAVPIADLRDEQLIDDLSGVRLDIRSCEVWANAGWASEADRKLIADEMETIHHWLMRRIDHIADARDHYLPGWRSAHKLRRQPNWR